MNKQAILKKYFQGRCSPEEVDYLLNHLQPEDVENYPEILKELWDEFNSYPTLEASVSERMYQNILDKGKISSVSTETRKAVGKEPKIISFQRLAAVLTGFLFLTAVSFLIFNHYQEVEHTTAFGEKEVIILPDSTMVTLNSNSSLTYRKSQFAGNSREVWISGEAYFDVRKRKVGKQKSKFIVHTEDVIVEVLGTRFNVNSRRATTEVVLETGKIKLSVAEEEKKGILMQPGDFVAYSSGDKKMEHKIVLPEEYSKWRNNKLVFNEATLENIAHEIEDHFGFKVIIENAQLRSKTYRGTFPSDNIDVLLESLSKSFDLEVVKGKEEIILKEYTAGTE